jgi:hypothetical protein
MAMKEFLKLCVVTAAGMGAIASLLHLAVALGNHQSPWESLISLGVCVGAFGLLGLMDTDDERPQQQLRA